MPRFKRPKSIAFAFERELIRVPLDQIFPLYAVRKETKETVKYRQVAASVSEVGLVEPLVVASDQSEKGLEDFKKSVGGGLKDNKDMMELVSAADKSAALWAAGKIPQDMAQNASMLGATPTSFHLSVNIDSGIDAKVGRAALLESVGVSDPDTKLGAVEKARLYLERFLNEERVFRDLFFALAN